MNSPTDYQRLLDLAPDIICRIDDRYRVVYANRAIATATGRSADSFIGHSLAESGFPAAAVTVLDRAFGRVMESGQPQRAHFEMMAPTGLRYYQAEVVPEQEQPPYPVMILYARDISAQKKVERELGRHATTDALTGLYNRHQFFALGRKDVARARRYQKPFTLATLDLDGFDGLTSTYGEALTEHILIRIARILSDALRASDFICHFEGARFVIGMFDTPAHQAQGVSERIRRQIEALEIFCADLTLSVTASIGIGPMQSADENISQIYLRAEQALHASKCQGGNRVTVAEGAEVTGADAPAADVTGGEMACGGTADTQPRPSSEATEPA